jgi:hypothetical protein
LLCALLGKASGCFCGRQTISCLLKLGSSACLRRLQVDLQPLSFQPLIRKHVLSKEPLVVGQVYRQLSCAIDGNHMNDAQVCSGTKARVNAALPSVRSPSLWLLQAQRV